MALLWDDLIIITNRYVGLRFTRLMKFMTTLYICMSALPFVEVNFHYFV